MGAALLQSSSDGNGGKQQTIKMGCSDFGTLDRTKYRTFQKAPTIAKFQTAVQTTCPFFRRFAGVSNAEVYTKFGICNAIFEQTQSQSPCS